MKALHLEPHRPLKLACVGCGARAQTRIQLAAPRPDKFQIVAGADLVPERVEKLRLAAANPEFRGFASAKAMLSAGKLADAMIIATQDDSHHEYCRGALRAGCTLRQYTTDARALADSVIHCHNWFKPDAVWLSADTRASAEAMGVKVGASDHSQPFGGLGELLVRTVLDIDRIPAPNVDTQDSYPLMLEALSRVVDALGKDVFIVACFNHYPFSLAVAVHGGAGSGTWH